MDAMSLIAIDLAKNVFHLHGVTADGAVAFRAKPRRNQVLGIMASQPPCRVAMEACATAHWWARQLEGMGHSVGLIAPICVKPFLKHQKNDAADAEAIAKAAMRPTMRFVAVKTTAQQERAMVLRTCDTLVATAHPNHRRPARPSGRARDGRAGRSREREVPPPQGSLRHL